MTIQEILAWVDEHRRLTGRWPRSDSEPKGLPLGETWHAVQSALNMGQRGLPGGSSLARLLAEHRGLRGPLTIERILAWVDAHRAATGEWPTRRSGRVRGVEGESWEAIDFALLQGRRGLPVGSSLARLLAETRPVRNVHTLPRLTIEQILAWADAYHAKTGRWPRSQSGRVDDAPGETWGAVESALFQGLRGLPGGVTLAQLLVERRGAPAVQTTRPLTVDRILAWADAYHAATGRWPVEGSGPVSGAPGESWSAISLALAYGNRGLPGGSSLARLLAERRGARNPKGLPRLTIEQILAWAEAHRAATGRWPSLLSGPVSGAPAPGESWAAINQALSRGFRGLPGGLSLARVLRTARPDGEGSTGVKRHPTRYPTRLPRLTIEQILAWAEAHRAATGRWPSLLSGPVSGAPAPGETWLAINQALRHGRRGLPRGSTLAQVLYTARPDGHGSTPRTMADSEKGMSPPVGLDPVEHPGG